MGAVMGIFYKRIVPYRDSMRTKWQWMIAVISSVQLVYLVLGISGVFVIMLPALGSAVAIMQGGVALYAFCWLPIAIALLRSPVFPVSPLGAWAPMAGMLFLAVAGQTAVLCSLGAVATWSSARHRRRTSSTQSSLAKI
jgi:hypothetical protein